MITRNLKSIICGRHLPLFALIPLLGLALAGCVTKPPMASAIRSTTLRHSPEAVWKAVLQEAATINTNTIADWTLGTIKVPATMIYEANFPIRDYAYEPAGVGKHWTSSRVQADFQVKEIAPGQTTLTVDCRFFRFDANADAAWRPWVSNGYYEQYLLKQVEGRLSH